MIFQSFSTNRYRFVNFIELTEEQHMQVWQVRILESVRKYMFNKEVFSFQSHLAFVEKLKDDKTKLYYAIFDEYDNFLGSINLHPINYQKKEADWGIYINPNYQKSGIGQILANCFFEYIFSFNIIDRITAVVLDFNEQSTTFHKRVGFQCQKNENGQLFFIKERI